MNKKLFVFQKTTPRAKPPIEPDEVEFQDEGLIAYKVWKSPLRLGGPWKVETRCYGRVEIDGVLYEWDEVRTFTLKKDEENK